MNVTSSGCDFAVAAIRVHQPTVRRMGQESDGVPSLVNHGPLTLRPAEDRLDDLDIRRGNAAVALGLDDRCPADVITAGGGRITRTRLREQMR